MAVVDLVGDVCHGVIQERAIHHQAGEHGQGHQNHFGTGEDKEIVPFLRGFSVISKNGFEEVIKYKVKLRSDGACLEIPNQAHGGRVEWRVSHVLSVLRPRVPFGNFPSIT